MKEYLAPRIVTLARFLLDVRSSFIFRDDKDPEDVAAVAAARKEIKPWLVRVLSEANFLGLPSTARQAKRISSFCDSWTANEIASELEQLERRFDEETEAFTLFYIPSEKLVFYNKTDLFGEDFKTNFPKANAEISEAGNCFAFDRFTACAFHLMRSLEVVLKVLFDTLGLPPIATPGAQNWNGILRDIKNKLDADKTISDHAFYDGAFAFLTAAKNPMRNATMHVDAVYDESSVRSLYDAVGAFMRHVAIKLKETP